MYGPHVGQGKNSSADWFDTSISENKHLSCCMISIFSCKLAIILIVIRTFPGDFFCDVQPLIQSAMDGYNVSIFAYGQTNSGKTHTMVPLSPPKNRKVIKKKEEEGKNQQKTEKEEYKHKHSGLCSYCAILLYNALHA